MSGEFDTKRWSAFVFERYPMPTLRPIPPEDEFKVAEAAMAAIEAIIRKQVLPFEPAFRALGKRRRARSKAGGTIANVLSGDDITEQIKAAALEVPCRLVHQVADDPSDELAFADASAGQRYLAYFLERLARQAGASLRVAILEVVQQLARDIQTTSGKLSATRDRDPPATPQAEQRSVKLEEIRKIARRLIHQDRGRRKPRSQLHIARLVLIERGQANPTLRQCKTLVERCRRAGIALIVPR